ncbi:MAG: DUF4301 family protein, partial [Bacteroidales bacterium]|nr:DUF4301 family protein [Bacteroidales bacterium]
MITEQELTRQKKLLQGEGNFVNITAPATPEKGIKVIEDQQKYINLYDAESKKYSVMKFVPA